MAKKKISDAEAEVIKDAIIDALENNEEVATEEVAAEETATEDIPTEETATEDIPTEEEAIAPEVVSPGHHSRDFKA